MSADRNRYVVQHLITLTAATAIYLATGALAARLRPIVEFGGVHWDLVAPGLALILFSLVFSIDRRTNSTWAAVLWYQAKCFAIWAAFTLGWSLFYDGKTGPDLSLDILVVPLAWWLLLAVLGGLGIVAVRFLGKTLHNKKSQAA